MSKRWIGMLMGWVAAFAAALPLAAADLVLVEQKGCIYCAMFDREIAPAYPKTSEGKFAPLRRIDLHRPVPDDLDLKGPLRITPTFIVVVDGVEKARLEGYPGDAFFWPMLDRLLREHTNYQGETG